MIDLTKNITRNTRFQYRGKDLIIRITPQGILVKLAFQPWSKAALAPFEVIYDMAQKLSARSVDDRPITKVKRGLLSVR